MHPLIARYLSPEAAREALRKEKAGEALEPEERLFVEVAAAHPDKRSALPGGKRTLSSDAQAALVFLAAHAAARALGEDPALAAAAARARESLAREGASPEETEAFIASILLEEAFGYEEEVDRFDASYVQEALGEVPALAALTREHVEALLSSFTEAGATAEQKAARERIAQALVDIAWSEGPTPINPEHMEVLLESQLEERPEAEQEEGLRATVDFLEVLAREGLIGPQRLSRLRAVLGDEEA